MIEEDDKTDLTIIGIGAGLGLALNFAAALRKKSSPVVRVISFPYHRLLEKQSRGYKRDMLRRLTSAPIVAIEPYAALG